MVSADAVAATKATVARSLRCESRNRRSRRLQTSQRRDHPDRVPGNGALIGCAFRSRCTLNVTQLCQEQIPELRPVAAEPPSAGQRRAACHYAEQCLAEGTPAAG